MTGPARGTGNGGTETDGMTVRARNADHQAGGGSAAFVTVTVAGLGLALPLAEVREVIRPPKLVRIPLGPPSLKGLAQRQGVAMPVLDLGQALARQDGREDGRGNERADEVPDEVPDSAAVRVVVVQHHGQPVGLLVDGMAGMLRTAPDRIDPLADDEAPAVDAALLAGVLRDSAVAILSVAALIDRQFGDLWNAAAVGTAIRTAAPAAVGTPASAAGAGPAAVDEVRLVTFAVAGQEFALPVDQVQEILPVPDGITRMAKAKAHLLGVMTLRDRLLPLVGLRVLYGLGKDGGGAGRRVVVVRPGGEGREGDALVGVVVDAVRDILRIGRASIDPVPPLLAREPEFADLDGIARADGGRRLVSVLSAGRMFRHGLSLKMEEAGKTEGAGTEGEAALMDRTATSVQGAVQGAGQGAGQGGESVERFVVFRLAGAEYGLPIDVVQEVMRRPEAPTPLPNAPDFVAGILTLRGAVLPLIDQRRLLHLPAAGTEGRGAGARGRVVVVARGEARVGLLVDGLSGLLTVPERLIGPAPAVSVAQRRLIRRVATLEVADGTARLILLMAPDSLLDLESLSALLPSALLPSD